MVDAKVNGRFLYDMGLSPPGRSCSGPVVRKHADIVYAMFRRPVILHVLAKTYYIIHVVTV